MGKRKGRGIAQTDNSWKGDILLWLTSILMFLPLILVVIFYDYYHLELLVSVGWIVLVFSIVIIFLSGYEFRKKGASKGRTVVYTTVLVDTGIYAIIRHPQYLGFITVVLALVLMSQHWLSVISGITGSILFFIYQVQGEEQDNIKKFGSDYKQYMDKVPRMNFVLGVIRYLRHRKNEQDDE
jgi:protein-S-isoprenylcysteine O-methyltransferase Ste14